MNFDLTLPVNDSRWNNNRLHFFKYMSTDVAKIVLNNRTLRWSTPRTMNDIYDVQFELGLIIDYEILNKLSYEKMWQVASGQVSSNDLNDFGISLRRTALVANLDTKEQFLQEFDGVVREGCERMVANLSSFQNEFRKHLEDLKILCLTVDPTSPPMWAHYAQQNTGVVIRFRSVPALDSPYVMAKPVNYLNKLPPLMDEQQISNLAAGIRDNNTRLAMDRMIYSKGGAWSYEKEWRISSGSGRKKTATYEDIPFGINEIDGIIFGIRTGDQARKDITVLSKKYPNIELLEAVRSESGFHHSIRSI